VRVGLDFDLWVDRYDAVARPEISHGVRRMSMRCSRSPCWATGMSVGPGDGRLMAAAISLLVDRRTPRPSPQHSRTLSGSISTRRPSERRLLTRLNTNWLNGKRG
jgi:hypothetical protein